MNNNVKRYNEDFKADIIRLVREEKRPVSSIVKDFGVNDQTVRNWLKQAKDKQDPGRIRIAELEAELKETKKKIAEQEVTIEILKKATAILSAAYATQPEFSIIIAEPPANLYFATLPQIVNVSGTFSINSAQDFNLAVKRTADPDTAYTNLVSVNAIPGNIWGPFPWTITTAAAYGSYTLRVTAKHGNRDYVQTKVITVHPLLTTSTPNIPVIRGNPAAPAIARRILKHNGIPNNYNGVNLVNAVAREMGPRNTFRLVSRKDRVAYQLAVYSYLKTFVVSLP